MSFQLPSNPPHSMSAETIRQQEQDLEAKAARYAQTHPDRFDREPGPVRRLLTRVRGALRRQPASD